MAGLAILPTPTPVADQTVKALTDHGSLINAFIPELIKRRAGRLPSLRRSLSVASSDTPPTPPPRTPPPPYTEPQDVEGDEMSETASVTGALASTGMAQTSGENVYAAASETSISGVRWKHVGEGSRLLECAGREAASDAEDPELARKMYIDGVGYLLKALPDLNETESAQLTSYLPASLRPHPDDDERRPQSWDVLRHSADPERKNYVYDFMTLATMYGVLLASIVLPLLERLTSALWRYDQRYRISTRVADTTARTASAVAGKVFASLNEGKTGQVALGMTLYTIDGASRGILDGYAQALRRQAVVAEVNVSEADDGGLVEES